MSTLQEQIDQTFAALDAANAAEAARESSARIDLATIEAESPIAFDLRVDGQAYPCRIDVDVLTAAILEHLRAADPGVRFAPSLGWLADLVRLNEAQFTRAAYQSVTAFGLSTERAAWVHVPAAWLTLPEVEA